MVTTRKPVARKPATRKTTRRRTTTNPRGAGINYKVFMKVVNGPFKTVADAKKASAIFNKNGRVDVSNFRTLRAGVFYDTTVGWAFSDAKQKNIAISKLNAYAAKSKIPGNRVKITTVKA